MGSKKKKKKDKGESSWPYVAVVPPPRHVMQEVTIPIGTHHVPNLQGGARTEDVTVPTRLRAYFEDDVLVWVPVCSKEEVAAIEEEAERTSFPNPTVTQIVERWLTENKYDGLFNSEADCACGVGGLAPCGYISGECEAGFRVKCGDECGLGCGFHIGRDPE